MEFPFEKTASDENQTREIAREFADALKPGDVVLLTGNLGAGKTFFVKSVLANFGVENVNSPTFAIVNEYVSGKMKFYHFDFYRINREYELYDIGIEDYLSDETAVTFIEWADLFPDVIFKATYKVETEIIDTDKRRITITEA